jgi:uncharacterized surface anchored protein
MTTIVNFFLLPNPGSIIGKVTSETGQPIAGAKFLIFQDSTLIASELTDNNGNYSIVGLAPGSYIATAKASNFGISALGAIVNSNDISVVNFVLSPSAGTISGRVTDAATKKPISGASIQVFSDFILISTALTDPNGNYQINDIAPGSYNVIASNNNYQSQIIGAIVNQNATTIVDFALKTNPGTISGTVIDATNSKPIAGATILLFTGRTYRGNSITDNNGNYIISNLAPGDYIVVASAKNFQTISQGATVEAGMTTIVNFSGMTTIVNFSLLPNPGSIIGKVTSETGQPIAGAKILIFQDFTLIASALTDNNGNYSIIGLAPGSYIAIANAPNFGISALGAIVSANKISVVNFVLSPHPGTISGRVIDAATKKPISGATINVFNEVISIATAITDPNGNYQISDIEPGDYNVIANKANFQMKAIEAIVKSNSKTIVNFALLGNPGTISGIVTNATNSKPIANTTIALYMGKIFFGFALTDMNGRYEITDLAPGNYFVVATAQGFQTQFTTKTVFSNEITTANFVLNSNPGQISGKITAACTPKNSGGALLLVTKDSVIVGFGLSDNSGEYLIQNLAPGNYTVTVIKRNFLINSAITKVASNVNTTLNFIIIPNTLATNHDTLSVAIIKKYGI